jgi:colanic acid/amylovoran biosynthesis glycosyltransferase
LKVAVLTTSYPRFAGDAAGRFVEDAVNRLRARGVAVEVVSPASFRHFGLAYGSGIVGNIRRRPWRAPLVPLFMLAFWRAARRAAREADVVHAHWLPSAAIAVITRRPVVLQVWGTDVEIARRVRVLARVLLRRVHVVVAPSAWLAERVRALGVRDVRVIPVGVDVPADPPAAAEPPTILFAGRLSPEKGILELAKAAEGLPLVVVGDGPLRECIPSALGFVPHDRLRQLYEQAAVVACPSYREGFGVVCAEAMAYGRAVVATPVGGHLDLVEDGVTGLLVQPGDVDALRTALQRLLSDRELRRRLGDAARKRVSARFSWDNVTDATLAAYEDAIGEEHQRRRGDRERE